MFCLLCNQPLSPLDYDAWLKLIQAFTGVERVPIVCSLCAFLDDSSLKVEHIHLFYSNDEN